MTREEHARLETLDTILRSEDVRERIGAIVERVRAELSRKNEAVMTWESLPLAIFGRALPPGIRSAWVFVVMTWESLPLAIFGRALPPGIRSAWVFVLRAGADTGAERHPNSCQRMMSFEGSGNMQTGEPGQWKSNVLVSDPKALLERRWISIPPNVWHRPLVGADADWAVVSFHTVPADELIEERPDSSRKDGTKQMKYLAKK